MEKLKLTLGCGDYDLHTALIDGTVEPNGIDLSVITAPSPERHWRMWRHQEFDICELSMCSTLIAKSRKTHPFTMIPVFPHRRMRHSYIYVNADAGINSPKDLEGKRIGVRHWQTTAVHWGRGILQDYYGVDLRSAHYICQDEEPIPGILPVAGFDIQRIAPGRTVDEMLCTGELDALIYPETPPSIVRQDPRTRRLFPDVKQEEIKYFKETGFFPIMHTVGIKDSLLAEHPWVAVEMMRAFQRSKEIAYDRLRKPESLSLAWMGPLWEEQVQVLGPDPWPIGLEANRKELEAMIRWGVQFGMMPHPIEVEEFFAPSVLDVVL